MPTLTRFTPQSIVCRRWAGSERAQHVGCLPRAWARWTLIFFLVCAAAPAAARPAGSGLSIAVSPTELALPPGARATGVVVLTNAGTAPATGVRLVATGADSSVRATPGETPTAIAAGASVAVRFELYRASEGTAQDVAVRFVLSYRRGPAGRTDPSGVAVATLTMKPVETPAPVEVKWESKVETVNENRPGEAALVVNNPRETDAQVRSVEVTAPTAVSVKLTCPDGVARTVTGGKRLTLQHCAFRVPARSQETLAATFQPADAVAPGQRVVLVKVTASNADAEPASVVASTGFAVDIFAESDILKAVGVPVFLLLPGVLVVVIAWFLISKLSPWRRVSKEVSLGEVTSTATITAILGLFVSLLIAAAYPWLTRTLIPGYERDYLHAYGFRDFYYVFGYSFAIAVAVWLLAFVGGFVLVGLARWLFVPAATDKPAELLRKIGFRGFIGGGTSFARVSVKDGDKRALALRDSRLFVPVAPAIAVSGAGELKAQIEADVDADRPFRLWQHVTKAVKQHGATLSYRQGDIDRPRLEDRANLTFVGQQTRIVEVTPD